MIELAKKDFAEKIYADLSKEERLKQKFSIFLLGFIVCRKSRCRTTEHFA
jgi:hypothetical protein